MKLLVLVVGVGTVGLLLCTVRYGNIEKIVGIEEIMFVELNILYILMLLIFVLYTVHIQHLSSFRFDFS